MNEPETPNNPTSEFTEHAAKFLERDFNQCFTHLRHYDSLAIGLLKFAFTAYTALIGISVGLFQFSKKEGVDLVPVAMSILAIGFVVGFVMYLLLVRNRVYFVVVARYINEHRNFFLKDKPLGFQNTTGMYVSIQHPQFFNWRSSDMLFLFVVALLNSIVLFVFLYFVAQFWCAVFGGVLSLLAHVGGAIGYLSTRERKSADRSVFGRSTE